jgi:hypothetical protein
MKVGDNRDMTITSHLSEAGQPGFGGLSSFESSLQEKINELRKKAAEVMGPLSEREEALVALVAHQILL